MYTGADPSITINNNFQWWTYVWHRKDNDNELNVQRADTQGMSEIAHYGLKDIEGLVDTNRKICRRINK